MAVEYAGILAAVSLMAITLTGAYGKNVDRRVHLEQRGRRRGREGGKGAEGLARGGEGRVHARAVREAGAEVPLRPGLDRRHEEPGPVRAHASGRRTRRRTRRRARCAGTRSSSAQLKKRGISRLGGRRTRSPRASSRPAPEPGALRLPAGRRPPMMRRRLTIPRIVSPSTTGRWRKPLSSMICGASSKRHVGRRRDRVLGHPLTDARVARVHARGHRAEHVALGEDADQSAEVLDDDRADVLRAHALGDLAERVLGSDGDEGRLDDLAQGSHERGSVTLSRTTLVSIR